MWARTLGVVAWISLQRLKRSARRAQNDYVGRIFNGKRYGTVPACERRVIPSRHRGKYPSRPDATSDEGCFRQHHRLRPVLHVTVQTFVARYETVQDHPCAHQRRPGRASGAAIGGAVTDIPCGSEVTFVAAASGDTCAIHALLSGDHHVTAFRVRPAFCRHAFFLSCRIGGRIHRMPCPAHRGSFQLPLALRRRAQSD
jgi:hypothetical protein